MDNYIGARVLSNMIFTFEWFTLIVNVYYTQNTYVYA